MEDNKKTNGRPEYVVMPSVVLDKMITYLYNRPMGEVEALKNEIIGATKFLEIPIEQLEKFIKKEPEKKK